MGSAWHERVGNVFDASPRIDRKDTVWVDREGVKTELDYAFKRKGSQVCLDGPTGAGKTSLALNYLVSNKVKFIGVQATKEMDWISFCRQLVAPEPNSEWSVTGGVEFGVDKGLPTAKVNMSLGDRGRKTDDYDLIEKVASLWSEHDVAKQLAENEVTLFVDDMERASSALMRRLSDTCKLLGQSYASKSAKMVVVGSEDIFFRIHKENPALEERISQVSLGGFQNAGKSTSLLMKGFRRLKLSQQWYYRDAKLAATCREAVWEAADGLPKSLNRLGYDVAIRAENQKGITLDNILSVTRKMVDEHWREYSQRYPQVIDYLYSSGIAIEIVKCLYQDGIARIHRIDPLIDRIRDSLPSASASDVETAVNGLVQVEFLIRTGKGGELIFVKHPTAAHTLGVAMRNPERFREIVEFQRGRPSLQTAFPQPPNVYEHYESETDEIDEEQDVLTQSQAEES
jgi:hypothetical protein